jgi:hypothetical protein
MPTRELSWRLRQAESLVLAALACLAGCSQPPYEVAPVTGTVIIDGQPFTQGKVMFAPIAKTADGKAGKPAFGRVGPDGAFTLSTYATDDGAVVGDHRVTVMHDGPDAAASAKSPSPAHNFTSVVVPKKVSVAAGQANSIDITLSREEVARFRLD